ncbi:hypothetical protein AGMMS4957_01680 [Bacteroidia bacterium]|nr:hypothetical protein AGMMS4957_01680 [Bacteroidia bacterium]
MKKIYLIGVLAALFSCSNDEMAYTEEKLTDELTAIATETLIPEPEKPDTVRPCGNENPSYPGEPGGGENPVPIVSGTPREEYIAFTGDDIEYFNISTREIVFTNLTVEDIRARVSNSTKLTFYFDGEPLFESTPIETGLSSYIYNDMVFTWFAGSFYLSDGYPLALGGDSHLSNNARQERDENTQKRAAEWDKFVKYLRGAGKTVE